MHRTFLGIGGDSISAMQVMAPCRTEGMAMDVQQLLRLATGIKIIGIKAAVPKTDPEASQLAVQNFPLLAHYSGSDEGILHRSFTSTRLRYTVYN